METEWSVPGLSNHNSRIPETDPIDPQTNIGCLESEKRVHRIHGTLETGVHKDPWQSGGAHEGVRRIHRLGMLE